MRISEVNVEALSNRQIVRLVTGDGLYQGEAGDVIFVFGGQTPERVRRAVELFDAGKAPVLFLTGGTKFGWSRTLSPTAQARIAAHEFWRAAASGDEAAVAAMLAAGADFTAAEVIAASRGLVTRSRPDGLVHRAMRPNRTGTEVLVMSELIDPSNPERRSFRILPM